MVVLVNYGLGNLRSVSKALEAAGAEVEITADADRIIKASAIVLPGVGAFARGMENLKRLGILPFLFRSIAEGKPFLGICLGMQLLFTESEEHGLHCGLDIIKGRVIRFTSGMKIPHMGWNQVRIKKNIIQKNKIFNGIPDGSYFYFVHTYYVEPNDTETTIAMAEYGKEFAAVVNKENVWGVQFHPEKSAESGLKFLKNFLQLC